MTNWMKYEINQCDAGYKRFVFIFGSKPYFGVDEDPDYGNY